MFGKVLWSGIGWLWFGSLRGLRHANFGSGCHVIFRGTGVGKGRGSGNVLYDVCNKVRNMTS